MKTSLKRDNQRNHKMLTIASESLSVGLNHRDDLDPLHRFEKSLIGRAGTLQMGDSSAYVHQMVAQPDSASFRDTQDDIERLLYPHQRERLHSPMSAEDQVILTIDPMVNILAAFYLIPDDYQDDLFDDFRGAADARDLRQLLDTISNWAATAELYAHPSLAADLQEAIGGRKGVADWLPG